MKKITVRKAGAIEAHLGHFAARLRALLIHAGRLCAARRCAQANRSHPYGDA